MYWNLSLLLLNLNCNSNSQIISIGPSSHSISFNSKHINIHNIFNSFLYKNSKIYKSDFNFISHSAFIKTLNAPIYLAQVDIILPDKNFTDQLHVNKSTYADTVQITNCLFSHCSNTASNPDGGGLHVEVSHCHIISKCCIFEFCKSSGYGGAIYSVGQVIDLSATIFRHCESAETGSIIFFNKYKRSLGFTEIQFNQSLFANSVSKSLPLDINVSFPNYMECNVSHNENTVLNDPASSEQQCAAVPFIATENDQVLTFMNVIGNSGDFLFDVNHKDITDISYVNVIDNFNLNFFFINNPDYPQTTNLNSIKVNYFTFFGNKASQKAGTIKMANDVHSSKFELVSCIFESSQNDVISMMNGHDLNGGTFDRTITVFTQNFPLNDNLCSFVFAVEPQKTATFTPSSHFTPSNFFTPERTKPPDPMDIFNRAKVTGNKTKLFSKEELKKAAAPATISMTLIIVCVVMFILYLRRKLYEIKNRDKDPDFDTSFGDDEATYSDYSYSYYTYTEYYVTASNNSGEKDWDDSSSSYMSFVSDF